MSGETRRAARKKLNLILARFVTNIPSLVQLRKIWFSLKKISRMLTKVKTFLTAKKKKKNFI